MLVEAKIGPTKESSKYGDYWIEEIKVTSMATAKEELEELINEFNEVEYNRYNDKKSFRRLISYRSKNSKNWK